MRFDAPGERGPQRLLARAIEEQRRGRVDAALALAREAAMAGDKWPVEAAVLEGEILFRAGRIRELGERLAQGPGLAADPRGVMLKARWLARSGDPIEAEKTLLLLMESTNAAFLYRMAAFERVGILLRQGRHDEAWEAAEEAHRRTSRPYPVDRLVSALDQSLQWAREGRLARMARARRPVDGTAFILGMPRSGTSLLEQMLDRHPRVAAMGETNLPPSMGDSMAESGGGWPVAIFTCTQDLLAFWQQEYVRETRARWGVPPTSWTLDKTVFPMLQPLVVATVFPGAKVLRITRDPRDNATSLFLSNFDPSWGWTASLDSIRRVLEAERRCVDALLEAVGVDFQSLRYEALVEDPESHTRAALDLLGLPWHPDCLRPEENPRTVMTLSHEQVRRPINRSSIGRWRHHARRFGSGWPDA